MKRVLIKCGWLVTLDPKIGEMKGGELLYNGNTIEAVGHNLGASADEVIDASDKIVMPGLVNAHMHTWETALRGIGAEWMSADYFKHVHSNLATIRNDGAEEQPFPAILRCPNERAGLKGPPAWLSDNYSAATAGLCGASPKSSSCGSSRRLSTRSMRSR